jgi:hypothetical protein
MPLAFFVLPPVDLLRQGKLRGQHCQDNKKELFWHNNPPPYLDSFTFFQSPAAVDRPLVGVAPSLPAAYCPLLATAGR